MSHFISKQRHKEIDSFIHNLNIKIMNIGHIILVKITFISHNNKINVLLTINLILVTIFHLTEGFRTVYINAYHKNRFYFREFYVKVTKECN